MNTYQALLSSRTQCFFLAKQKVSELCLPAALTHCTEEGLKPVSGMSTQPLLLPGSSLPAAGAPPRTQTSPGPTALTPSSTAAGSYQREKPLAQGGCQEKCCEPQGPNPAVQLRGSRSSSSAASRPLYALSPHHAAHADSGLLQKPLPSSLLCSHTWRSALLLPPTGRQRRSQTGPGDDFPSFLQELQPINKAAWLDACRGGVKVLIPSPVSFFLKTGPAPPRPSRASERLGLPTAAESV